MNPMLADQAGTTPAERDEMMGEGWLLQQKLNGERLLIESDGAGTVTALNRRGERAQTVPLMVVEALAALGVPVVLDGELVAGRFVAFDMPQADGRITVATPLEVRLQGLGVLLETWGPLHLDDFGRELPITAVVTAFSPDEKLAMLEAVAEARGEGWVAKRLGSTYQPSRRGRRSRDWRKIKRVRDIDCVVEWVNANGKANMGLTVFRDGELVEGGWAPDGTRKGGVGECGRLTGDGGQVQVGDVVTVQVLSVSDRNRLCQPTLPRLRLDKAPEECLWDQLEPLKADNGLILGGAG